MLLLLLLEKLVGSSSRKQSKQQPSLVVNGKEMSVSVGRYYGDFGSISVAISTKFVVDLATLKVGATPARDDIRK